VLQLPDEAILSEVLEAPGVQDWFNRAADMGDPDALFLALKLQERTSVQKEIFGKLLPYPFNPDNFFVEHHLKSIAACFKVLFLVYNDHEEFHKKESHILLLSKLINVYFVTCVSYTPSVPNCRSLWQI